MSPLKQKAVLMEFEPLNAADIRDDEACSDQSFCSRDTYERPLAVDDGRDVLAASAYSLHHSPTVHRRRPFKRRNRWTLSAAAGIAVIGAAAVIVSKYHGSRPVHLTGNDKSERPQVQYSNHFGVSPSGLQDTHKGLNLEGDAVLGSYIENAYLPAEVPPLSDLVKDEKIVGDISGLVDFAIIGNPKCGTTFLMVSCAAFQSFLTTELFPGLALIEFLSNLLVNSPALIANPAFYPSPTALARAQRRHLRPQRRGLRT